MEFICHAIAVVLICMCEMCAVACRDNNFLDWMSPPPHQLLDANTRFLIRFPPPHSESMNTHHRHFLSLCTLLILCERNSIQWLDQIKHKGAHLLTNEISPETWNQNLQSQVVMQITQAQKRIYQYR